MNKTALQELMYDVERAKNWKTIHNLIMDYANEEIETDISGNILDNFDEEWWNDFINSIEHGEILDESVKRTFLAGL